MKYPTAGGSTGSSYYRDAIVWAYENGIALGVSADKFAPDEAVTREQMVTFFARYAAKNDVTVSDGAELSAFKDGAKVSSYAAEVMAWAVKHGIVSGVGAALLDPQGTATRVQELPTAYKFSCGARKLFPIRACDCAKNPL